MRVTLRPEMVSRLVLALLLPCVTAGCVSAVSTVAHAPFTAVSVAKVPFKAGGKVVDWTTTSPSERDRAYVRKKRKEEERERREVAKRCHKSSDDPACQAGAGYRAS